MGHILNEGPDAAHHGLDVALPGVVKAHLLEVETRAVAIIALIAYRNITI